MCLPSATSVEADSVGAGSEPEGCKGNARKVKTREDVTVGEVGEIVDS